MKYFSLLIILCATSLNIYGQNIKDMIPNDPGFIMKVNGSALESELSMEYLDKLPVFQELLNDFYSWEERDQLKSMKDFGIDFKKDTYMFVENTDSMSVFYMIYPIEDLAKLEGCQSFKFSPEDIKKRCQENGSSVMTWTDNHLLFVSGEINKEFIKQDSTFKARYGFGASPYEYGYNDNYYYDEPAVEVYTEDGNSYYDDVAVEEAPYEEIVEKSEYEIIEGDTIYIDSEVMEEQPHYSYESEVETKDNKDPYDLHYHLKDSVTSAWLLNHANRTLSNKSIVNNKRISDVINSSSEASFYANYGDLVSQYLNLLGGGMSAMGYYSDVSQLMNMYSGIELTGDITFEEEEVKLYTEFITDDKHAKMYSKMSDSKFNKKMLKHMDLEEVLGYYSVSLNTEAILDFYPQFMGYFIDTQAHINGMGEAIADLMEVLLDEEAIADVMPGNFVLLCDGFTKQKMTFTSYDYDENFNRVEVTREVEENLPSFLMMIESNNFKTIKNWLNIAVRESMGMMTKTDYGYVINASSDIPVMMHVVFKDGIVYLCNDSNKMSKIVSGISTGSSNGEHKKLLTKNNSAVYVDAKKVMEVIPFPAYSESDKETWDLVKSKFKDLKIKQFQKDKNTVVSEVTLSGPDGMGNSWVSFWETLNEIYEIQTVK